MSLQLQLNAIKEAIAAQQRDNIRVISWVDKNPSICVCAQRDSDTRDTDPIVLRVCSAGIGVKRSDQLLVGGFNEEKSKPKVDDRQFIGDLASRAPMYTFEIVQFWRTIALIVFRRDFLKLKAEYKEGKRVLLNYDAEVKREFLIQKPFVEQEIFCLSGAGCLVRVAAADANPNCKLIERHGFLFVEAIDDIAPGNELLLENTAASVFFPKTVCELSRAIRLNPIDCVSSRLQSMQYVLINSINWKVPMTTLFSTPDQYATGQRALCYYPRFSDLLDFSSTGLALSGSACLKLNRENLYTEMFEIISTCDESTVSFISTKNVNKKGSFDASEVTVSAKEIKSHFKYLQSADRFGNSLIDPNKLPDSKMQYCGAFIPFLDATVSSKPESFAGFRAIAAASEIVLDRLMPVPSDTPSEHRPIKLSNIFKNAVVGGAGAEGVTGLWKSGLTVTGCHSEIAFSGAANLMHPASDGVALWFGYSETHLEAAFFEHVYPEYLEKNYGNFRLTIIDNVQEFR